MYNRRIYETIGVRYQDSQVLRALVVDVRAMLEAHPEIDTNRTLIVNFNHFGASSLDFFIYTFTKTTDWVTYHNVKEDVLLKVLDLVHQHGADVAFPTQTVHLESHLSPEPGL
jgi:MscS family membrane protein